MMERPLRFLLLFALAHHRHGAAPLPVPSGPQLRYQSTDFVALIHFNMATFARNGDPGCDGTNWNVEAAYATGPTSDPRTFAPARLNTTQWFDSIGPGAGLGANIAVLTAKHGCGFLLWPTRAAFDDGTPYGYHVRHDVARDFVESAKRAGVGYGFYYSIMKNFFLCRSFHGTNLCADEVLDGQRNVSADEYRRIVARHVTELWKSYGNFTEIWVDSPLGGFGDLMVKLQPTAAGTPAHPRSWCGTEGGHPSREVGPGPIWQTGGGFFGDPASGEWVDKFCDPQLFRDHIWFWEPNRPVRSLDEMIPIYHDIVGRGMVMELAFSINREGLVDPAHEAVYKQLGDWVRECYGSPIAMTTTTVGPNDNEFRLTIPHGAVFDRLMIQEAIAVGQRIRNYTIAVEGGDKLVPNGTSVGRKRIHVLDRPYLAVNAQTLVLTITHDVAPPQLSLFGVYAPCYPKRKELVSVELA